MSTCICSESRFCKHFRYSDRLLPMDVEDFVFSNHVNGRYLLKLMVRLPYEFLKIRLNIIKIF